MLKLLLTLALVGSLGTPDVSGISDKLYDDLLAYHEGRVDLTHRHETEEQRQERIRWIADGIPRACVENADLFDTRLGWTFKQCVAFGATMTKFESGLVKEVQEGTRRGPAGEICLFQLHRLISAVPDPKYRVTPEELAATVGLDAEAAYHCAYAGVKTIAWQIHRCGLRADSFTAPAEMFAEYHRPSQSCNATLTRMDSLRASGYRALLTKLH